MRGTQIDWVDTRAEPTILTNSVIEGTFDQKTMSCVTCHALAVKGRTGPSMPILPFPQTVNEQGFLHGYVGALDPALFLNASGEPEVYLGLDYVWTLRHAQREKAKAD